jgi:polyvinyl alcohol dehydrogenase (cytochrome)
MRQAALVVFLLSMDAIAYAQDGAALYTQHCASCHDSGARAPSRQVIGGLTADRIASSLTTGLMRAQGEALTPEQRLLVARYVSAAAPGPAPGASASVPRCGADVKPAATSRDWTAWGVTLANDRFQQSPGFTVEQVPTLKLKWAFGFDGEINAAANPTIAGDRVYVGSGSGRVYSLGLRDGCVAWTFKADGGVRAAVVVGAVKPGDPPLAFVSDIRATVYALDAATGELKWTRRLEEHPAARITGSPVLYGGRLFVPLSSVEEATGAQPAYECCKFRGSLIVVDASNGSPVWQTYTIREKPTPQGTNGRGVTRWGPSGAALWSSPTIDPRTGSVYVATGDGYSQPAAPTTDAVIAMDLATGAIKWVNQVTSGDVFTMACGGADQTNCPDKPGPDHDFGQSPILVTLPGGRRVLLAGQKSGEVHALDPDAQGRKLWTKAIGRGGELGGIEWGSASDGTRMFVPLSDIRFKEPQARGRGGLDSTTGGGMFALAIADGSVAWTQRANACGDRPSCSPALSAPAAAVPGAVFSGSVDGHFRAYASTTGAVIWDFDTAREFTTVNGVTARGGSIDVAGPAIAGGMVVTTSGYGQWGGMRGNVLLAFSVDGK